jgi:hypothetical protein
MDETRRHDRRAVSSSGKPARVSTGTVWFVFDDDAPTEELIRKTWENHRERNYQRVALCATPFIYHPTDIGVYVYADCEYGPVHGNIPSDYQKKAQRVGELLGAGNAGLLPGTFSATRQRTQNP